MRIVVVLCLAAGCDQNTGDERELGPQTVASAQAVSSTLAQPVKQQVPVAHTLEMRVLGMSCPDSCVANIRNALLAKPGIVSCNISFEEQLAVIGVDDRMAKNAWEKQLSAELDAVGYKAWPTSTESRRKGQAKAAKSESD